MSKFASIVAAIESPIRTTGVVGTTHEGGVGFARDAKSELFLLAVTNMVREGTFYESAKDRDDRYVRLIHQVTAEDPAWVRSFVPFLRDRVNLRSASLVMAAEYVRAGGTGGRAVVASAIQRADEPAEMLAYWHATHGRNIPKPVKRGVADAVARLYDERSALRYDGQDGKWRMADVLDLTHPTPRAPWQAALFRYLLAKRHKRDVLPTEGLATITAAHELEALPVDQRRAVLDDPERLKAAGYSWERLSGWLQGPMDAKAWEAIIPSMGYMALLRNLRNLEQAGVSKDVLAAVSARLSDHAEVARSRQMPLRFLSAWKATESVTFGPALEDALDASLPNVPALSGYTLVLIDVSGSMDVALSERSKAKRWEAAALFGAALARRAERADVFAYSNQPTRVVVHGNTSLLRAADAIRSLVGGGTATWDCARATFKGHDRVVILTDEQAHPTMALRASSLWPYQYQATTRPDDVIPTTVPIYTFNLAGHAMGHAPADTNRHTFGGLTDAGFTAIELLEKRRSMEWGALIA